MTKQETLEHLWAGNLTGDSVLDIWRDEGWEVPFGDRDPKGERVFVFGCEFFAIYVPGTNLITAYGRTGEPVDPDNEMLLSLIRWAAASKETWRAAT